MDYIIAERHCEHCQRKTRVRLSRNIAKNGASQVYWFCLSGNHPILKNGYFIPHEKIKAAGYEPDNLPVIQNYSGMELCAVCQSPFTELHHWAPHHLFHEEADQWPTAPLCKKHHDQWHAIVTPNMTQVSPTWIPTKSPSPVTR